MDEEDGASAWRDRLFKRIEIDLPAVIVNEFVRDKLNVLDVGEELKERIAGLRDEYFVTGFAKQAETIAVSLTGADGEDDVLGRDDSSLLGVVRGYGFAGGQHPLGGGLVSEDIRARERRENLGFFITKTDGGWIRSCEIEDCLAAGAVSVECCRKCVGLKIPVRALG